MKKNINLLVLSIIVIIFISLMIVGFVGCGGGGTTSVIYTPVPVNPTTPAGSNGIITGIIKDATGSVISNVSIVTGTTSVTSNGDGTFRIENIATGNDITLIFSKTGYVTTTKTMKVISEEENYTDVLMSKVDTVENITPSSASTIETGDASVSIPANSIVDASGQTVTSDVTAKMTSFVPANSNYYDMFPGQFAGVASDGKQVGLISYGFVNITLEDSSGKPLNLGNGQSADIKIKASGDGPQDMPLWYLDEKTGLWVEYGKASKKVERDPKTNKDVSYYQGKVTHFSSTNFDLAYDTNTFIKVIVMYKNREQNGARVQIKGEGWQRFGTTYEEYDDENNNAHYSTTIEVPSLVDNPQQTEPMIEITARRSSSSLCD